MTVPEPLRDRIPPNWGGPLNEADYAALAGSWVAREIADSAMLRRVDEYQGREVIGQKGSRDCAGILIPYYWPDEPWAFNYRLRRDHPDWKYDGQGNAKPDKKYLGPPKSSNRLYLPPGVTLDQLSDLSIPVALVEGEKKALALWRLARHETDTPRFIPLAIAGVWNWRGTVGKTNDSRGERVDVKGPIPDLHRVAWQGRLVYIVFDANVQSIDSVKWARIGISRELGKRGAKVDFINLPPDCGVNGIDDLLAAWGPARVLELFQNSVPGARLHVVPPPQFESKPDGMFRITTQGERLSQVQLSNYRATITANIRLDDGVETKREFEIAAELSGRRFQFTLPASEFARMDWPIERMGSSAITFPNQRDYARTAIQSFSMTAENRCIYTHTGWRNLDGHWCFLHAGGAICAADSVSDVSVRLAGAIERYQLQLPIGAEAVARAVKASLRLLELAPPSISFPLLAATYRAVFGDADFAMHVAGDTGAFKSEIAALHQQHFGPAMSRLYLPGAWSSTGNALEAQAFYAKDALFVIDDFAPQGSAADIARYHAAADRVFRAAGNRAGRSRLDSTAQLRDQKPPRALILSTGEDIPRGQSIRARLLILEMPKNVIDTAALSACQQDAGTGLYAAAMGAFIQSMAGRYAELRAALERKVAEQRIRALRNMAHARTPEMVANLQAAFELYMEFCLACGAVGDAEQQRLNRCCWDALRDAAAAQAKHQAASEPVGRFVATVRALLASGRAHLRARDGGQPDKTPSCCGWVLEQSARYLPHGECIGWTHGDDIYLEPTAAYRAVQAAGRDAGETLAVSAQTLNKRLHEKGWLASVDTARETNTIRRNLEGSLKTVLHFHRGKLLPEALDGEDENVG
jgi:hypothetical protein